MSILSPGTLRTIIFTSSLLAGCSTSPEERLLEGAYSAVYDPPLVGYATVNCDRLIPSVFLAVNAQGRFELAIDVTDDCSRVGGSVSPFQVLKYGGYTRIGPTLSFTPEGEGAPAFTGEIEGEEVRVTLPAEFEGLAPNELVLRLGLRLPVPTDAQGAHLVAE